MENETNKKGIIVGGIILIVVILFALLWFVFTQNGTTGIGNLVDSFNFIETPDKNEEVGTGTGGNINLPGTGNGSLESELALFYQLSDMPVAGLFATETGNKLRYVEREKGHIYELSGLSKDSTKKISHTTVPRVRDAYFGNGGESIILRFLEEAGGYGKDVVKTYLGRINLSANESEPGTIDGAFLADHILEVSISPDTNTLAFLLATVNGSSLQTMDLIERKPKEVLQSPISEWIPFLTDEGTVLLQSKASSRVPGYLFRYNPKQKTFEKVASNRLGMTSLPSLKGDRALFSENISGNPVFAVAGVDVIHEGEVLRNETPIGISSLGEKCVWSRGGRYAYCASFSSLERNMELPDSWYQGLTSLSDSFWRIDTETGETEIIGDSRPETGIPVDAIKLTLSGDESILYFINKTDGKLWGMRIRSQAQEVSTQTPPPSPEELRDIKGSSN